MNLLNGQIVFDFFIKKIKIESNYIIKKIKRKPCLATILVGNDYSSNIYIKKKISICKMIGFIPKLIKCEKIIKEKDLISIIKNLNLDSNIDGILVQLPLPQHINTNNIILSIDPIKDIDGFHPQNIGKMILGMPSCIIPATPHGILLLLQYYKISLYSKYCVVVGRSNIVGRPISILLSSNSNIGNATVTIVHNNTYNIKQYTKFADAIVVAVGKPYFITADMIKHNAIIIDVGINRIFCNKINKYKVVGDVKFDEVSKKASYITPVPGGIGPMTIIGLLKNTLLLIKQKINLQNDKL